MTRILVYLLCICLTCATPSRAAVPLALVGAAAVGAVVLSSSVGSYYAKNGTAPEYVSATAGAVASAADKIFQPAVAAVGPLALITAASFPSVASTYIGKDASIGISLGNIVTNCNASAAGLYTDFKALLASFTAVSPYTSAVNYYTSAETQNIPGSDGLLHKFGSGYWNFMGYTYTASPAAVLNILYGTTGGPDVSSPGGKAAYGANGKALMLTVNGSKFNMYVWSTPLQTTTDPPTAIAPPGAVNFPGLKTAWPTMSAGAQQDVRDLIRAAPGGQAVPAVATPATGAAAVAATPITAAEVQTAIAANTAAVAQLAASNAAAIAAANPLDVGAAIAAQQAAVTAADLAAQAAAADPALEEVPPETVPPETFAAIPVEAFTVPYNPGQFDIAARFTSFTNTIKASPVFSLTGFFATLPSGGESTFTVDAGTYGVHTVDLAETMGPGLAFLSKLLMICFGFYSIRAIILKR